MAERIVRITLAAQVSNYLTNVEAARKKTVEAGAAAEDASAAYERQNEAMTSMGVRLTALGAVATAAGALAVKAAIDWESAWAGVTKTVDGTPEQLADVEQGLRDLTGVLPAAHEEIAAVAEAAGQLGVETPNVVAFTRTMIDLGETTNLSSDQAATSLARLINILGTSQSQVSNLGSALVGLGNNYATTESEILDMAMRLAGAGRVVKLSEGEVLGLATALSSVGIEAEAGGSAVSKVMIDIAAAVDDGGERVAMFAEVAGMSAEQFSTQWRTAPAQALSAFVKGLANAESQGSSTLGVLAELGITEIRMRDALLRSSAAADLFAGAMEQGNQEFAANNALAEEAAKRYETVESKIAIAGNAVRDAAIDYGEVFLPAVRFTAEAVTNLAKGFGDLPTPILTTVAVGTALVGVVGLVGGAFLIAVPRIAAFNAQLAIARASEIPGIARAADVATTAIGRTTGGLAATARFLTGPWGVAIAAAVVGVGALQQVLDSLKASAEELENSAKTAVSADELLRTAFRGAPDGLWWDDGARAIDNFADRLDTLGLIQENFFERLLVSNQYEASDLNVALNDLGKTLAGIAGSDLPTAARAFELLVEKTDGSERQIQILLNAMPEFRDALVDVATAQGINVAAMTDAERAAALYEIAQESAVVETESAADAYMAAAAEAKNLSDEILALIDAVNAANGVGQDAVSANARYQSALAGIAEEVARQREEYERVNETLDGFSLSLDQGAAAGSKNAAMLAEVASAAQNAAGAQFQQDLATMSANDATQKYADTLAAQRQAFIDAANAAGFNSDEVAILADQIFKLPDEKTIEMIAETAQAEADLNWLARNRTTTITATVAPLAINPFPNLPGRAGGGMIPGTPSDKDNRVYALATGEFVVRSRQVAIPENRAALEYMNAGGTIRGYAGGGYVDGRNITYASSPVATGAGGGGGGPAEFKGTLVLDSGQMVGVVRGVISTSERTVYDAVAREKGRRE